MGSDDDLMPLLQELHNPNDNSDLHINRMWSLVQKIINRATDALIERSEDAQLEEEIRKGLEDNAGGQIIIGSISCQITSAILNGNDAHTVTMEVLKYLRNFRWEEKLMLTLTAFAINFGDFWLLVRNYANNVVNEPMTGDQREHTSSNKDAYKFQIEANNDFIKSLVNTTTRLFNIGRLPNSYAREFFGAGEVPYMPTSAKSGQFSVYVYLIMRCTIVAATQIIILSSRGLDQYLIGIPNPKEFDKLKSLNEHLTLKLSEFQERERKWYHIPRYLRQYSDIFEMMKRIISPEVDLHPLYHGVTKRKDQLDVLNGKRVLLLISGLNIASEDITNLKNVAIDSEKDEIVWIPVLKHMTSDSNAVKNQLESLQNSMPWYSIQQPSLISDSAIEAFIVEWDFEYRPILVFLSPQADELNINAIYMLRIWQNLHVDNLTSEMELQLWEKETWNLKLLVNDIDPIIQEWIQDERYILMYGSNDIDWIRNFIKQAQSVARNMLVHIEMVYVANNHNDADHGRKVQDVITTEQLSHCLPESRIASFWSRINSMIESKEKFGKMNDPSDKISQEIQRFKSHEEWVLLTKGSAIIGHVPCRIALTALEEVQKIGQCCSNYKFTLD